MGIGLSVSRSIIESHGAGCGPSPMTGPGATFAFSDSPPRPEAPRRPPADARDAGRTAGPWFRTVMRKR